MRLHRHFMTVCRCFCSPRRQQQYWTAKTCLCLSLKRFHWCTSISWAYVWPVLLGALKCCDLIIIKYYQPYELDVLIYPSDYWHTADVTWLFYRSNRGIWLETDTPKLFGMKQHITSHNNIIEFTWQRNSRLYRRSWEITGTIIKQIIDLNKAYKHI